MSTSNINAATTKLLSLLDISFPLLLAPMAGGICTPTLAATVSNHGGLGSIGGGYLAPEQLEKQIQETQKLTNHPFNVNLFIPSLPVIDQQAIASMQKKLNQFRRELGIPEQASCVFPPNQFEQQLEVVLAYKIPVFSFTFGLLSSHYMQALKTNHTIIIGTATNLEEAQALAAAGCDIVVAQGAEAGGHRGTFIGEPKKSLWEATVLTQQLITELSLPVVTAGGIMTGHDMAAVLALGAAWLVLKVVLSMLIRRASCKVRTKILCSPKLFRVSLHAGLIILL